MGYQSVFRRYEKKYLVTQEQYDRLAAVFAPRMERDRFSESTISTIYYDTPDFRLIRRSLDRPAYKEKLRLRTYRTPHADTEAFVEIMKKYDHVVYKRRIGMNYQQAVDYLAGAPAPEASQTGTAPGILISMRRTLGSSSSLPRVPCARSKSSVRQRMPESNVTRRSGCSRSNTASRS